jgi:cytochrome c553
LQEAIPVRRHQTGRRLLTLSALGVVLLGGLVVPGHAQTSRYNPLRAAYMRAHFHQALLLHDAVARGDIARARAEASVLAEISPTVPMPPGAEAFQGALTQAAHRAAAAASLEDAAFATATLFGTCGQCHRANHIRAAVPVGTDVKVGGLVGHMLLHQKGADNLLEGLVAPSDAQWVEGVRIFASPKFDPRGMPGKTRKAIEHGETELAVLAGHAAPAQRTRDRVDVYGKVIATCGNCHRQHARFGGPDRR